jgi:hypothetical protein
MTIVIIILIHVYVIKKNNINAFIQFGSSKSINTIDNKIYNNEQKIKLINEEQKNNENPIKITLKYDNEKDFTKAKKNIETCQQKKNKKSLFNSKIKISKIIINKSNNVNVQYNEQDNSVSFVSI